MTGHPEWDPAATVAGELRDAGYETHLCGKLHLQPTRRRFGFEAMDLAESSRGRDNDYLTWLRGRGAAAPLGDGEWRAFQRVDWASDAFAGGEDAGVLDGVAGDRFPGDARSDGAVFSECFVHGSASAVYATVVLSLTVTSAWTCRDLWLGTGFRRLRGRGGGWIRSFRRTWSDGAGGCNIDPAPMHHCRAGYYGLVNHVDMQLNRLFQYMRDRGLLYDTFIMFVSDHGEMLGDHHMFAKTWPYEASVRVPFLARAPQSMGLPRQVEVAAPVGLQDVMPTLLDAAGCEIPESVTGRSVLPWMRGETPEWRDVLHGEHAGQYREADGNHWIVNERHKYIWFSQTGEEHLFDVVDDPNEERDLASRGRVLSSWRGRLAEELAERPEGFSRGRRAGGWAGARDVCAGEGERVEGRGERSERRRRGGEESRFLGGPLE